MDTYQSQLDKHFLRLFPALQIVILAQVLLSQPAPPFNQDIMLIQLLQLILLA
jgi:hypothetical protein